MNNKPAGKQNMTFVAALLLFVVFAVSVVSVLLTGAGAYRRLTEGGQKVYESQTLSQFIETKVRQTPSRGAVSAETIGGCDALALRECIDGDIYVTRVYCYDGWLMELYCAEDGEFLPEDGEKLLPAQSMSVSAEAGLMTVCITDQQGETQTLLIRAGEPAGGAA